MTDVQCLLLEEPQDNSISNDIDVPLLTNHGLQEETGSSIPQNPAATVVSEASPVDPPVTVSRRTSRRVRRRRSRRHRRSRSLG